MNVVLSCYAKKGKGSYILEKGGKVIDSDTFSIRKQDDVTLKEYIFEAIIRGLNATKHSVEHEDLLLINIQNNHMSNWLNGSREYKGYDKYLDTISDIIESLDCKYMFAPNGAKKAKDIIDKKVSKDVLEGAMALMQEL